MNLKILGLVIVGAGCIAALPAHASSTVDGALHGWNSGSAIWESGLSDSAHGSDFIPKTRHYGTGMRDLPPVIWRSPPLKAAAAPEIDQASAGVALTLLLGAVALLRARRHRA